jgi:hypothetical protein
MNTNNPEDDENCFAFTIDYENGKAVITPEEWEAIQKICDSPPKPPTQSLIDLFKSIL